MQVFFAISCLLAVLALSNGAPIALTSEKEVDQPQAEVEAQDAVASVDEVRQVAETVSQSRAVDAQANEEGVAVADSADVGAVVELQSAAVEPQSTAVESSSTNEEADGAVREKRTLLIHQLLRRITCRGGCSGNSGCGRACGQANPCQRQGGCASGSATSIVVVPRPVPVAQPVRVPVNIVKVVQHPVPVPHPVAVPVTKFVPVPVPIVGQAGPCCNQAAAPCSPCSG